MNPIINVGVKAVRRVGRVLLTYLDRLERSGISTTGRQDFLGEINRVVKQDIIETIHYLYPNHLIQDEASDNSPQLTQSSMLTNNEIEWIICPIDGATNYLHGHPHFCVSLATRIKGCIEHAIVFDPLRDEIYTAARGQGAQLNNRRTRVSNQSRFDQSLISTGVIKKDMKHTDVWINSLKTTLLKSSTIRYSGSSTLDLAYVSCSRLDGYWELGLSVRHLAAGSLLVRESGGLISDLHGKQYFLETGNVVAANQRIFNELMILVKGKLGNIQ